MSDAEVLFNLVQPSDGWTCIVGISDKSVKQEFCQTFEEAGKIIAKYEKAKRNVFFGVAKYKDDISRKKENVESLKAFWLDIDCGEDKHAKGTGYADQASGVAALRTFLDTAGFPRPVLVSSGRGLHVYWPLNEAISRQEWEPVASRLREVCQEHGLIVDPAVFEAARILRVPGTLNFKDSPPKEVEILKLSTSINFVDFKVLLGITESATTELGVNFKATRPLSKLAQTLNTNTPKDFQKILEGCAQLTACVTERKTLSEPRWFDALSVAQVCEDRDGAIRQVSEDHPNYNFKEADRKAAHTTGPHRCNVFDQNNPGVCGGCIYFNKIGSPATLGATDHQVTHDGVAFTIPKFPPPFERGPNGGIMLNKGKDGQELIYEYDLYVLKRMRDPNIGEVIILRAHYPQDGVHEFSIPSSIVGDASEMRATLASNGVMCVGKNLLSLVYFIQLSIKNMQHHKKAEQMRLQFGWADNDTKFIIGNREITKDGIHHSPPSLLTASAAPYMVPTGSLDLWRDVFSLYGRKGLEPYAFAALTAFGSPLLKFLGQRGAIINLINSQSGQGKTTALHMCNSVYGKPDALCLVKEDTANAKIMRVGIYNNIPPTFDEMTNCSPLDLSTLAYSISQGRGKDRVKQSANELRHNATRWNCIALCSSNSSFYEKISSLKSSPDGEMMRIIEYKVEPTHSIEQAMAKHMFDHQLMENYGHAGDIYASWLVSNLEEAKSLALEIQGKVDRELKLTQRERFWSAVVAANFAGGLIAKKYLDLIDWDMQAIFTWATDMIQGIRKEAPAQTEDVALGMLGDFILRHMQNILCVNDAVDRRTSVPMMPTMEPRGDLVIRIEPDTKKMFIVNKVFRSDCVSNQVNYREAMALLGMKGMLVGKGLENKRMSKGTKVNAPGVTAIILDLTHPDFADLNKIVPDVAVGS